MFAGMGLFMLGIVFGEWIDLWYCRTKYDRDDSYKVIEERENTARKLNREKQKLEKEVHSLYRQIEHITKEWGFEKARLEDSISRLKASSSHWNAEWRKKNDLIWQVLDILAPDYKKLSEKEFFGKWGPNLSQESKPVESKEEWFDLSKARPNEGWKVELKNKATGSIHKCEYVDRSSFGVSLFKKDEQKHTTTYFESDWEWRPI